MTTSELTFSDHALKRMQKRVLRLEDFKLILAWGSQVSTDVYIMMRKDSDRLIADLKRVIRRIERMTERPLRLEDLELILAFGSQISTDAYAMMRKDTNRLIADLKHAIRRIERMTGFLIVVKGSTAVTCYRPNAQKMRRMLGKGKGRR